MQRRQRRHQIFATPAAHQLAIKLDVVDAADHDDLGGGIADFGQPVEFVQRRLPAQTGFHDQQIGRDLALIDVPPRRRCRRAARSHAPWRAGGPPPRAATRRPYREIRKRRGSRCAEPAARAARHRTLPEFVVLLHFMSYQRPTSETESSGRESCRAGDFAGFVIVDHGLAARGVGASIGRGPRRSRGSATMRGDVVLIGAAEIGRRPVFSRVGQILGPVAAIGGPSLVADIAQFDPGIAVPASRDATRMRSRLIPISLIWFARETTVCRIVARRER